MKSGMISHYSKEELQKSVDKVYCLLPASSKKKRPNGLAAGEAIAIEVHVNIPIRPRYFVVESACAKSFNIHWIVAHRLNVLAGYDPLAATLMTQEAQKPIAELEGIDLEKLPALDFPIIPCGSQISISIENISNYTAHFSAVFYVFDLTPSSRTLV